MSFLINVFASQDGKENVLNGLHLNVRFCYDFVTKLLLNNNVVFIAVKAFRNIAMNRSLLSVETSLLTILYV